MMHLTADKNINIRIDSPVTSAVCAGYIPANTSVEITDLMIGEKIEGNSVWYKSKAGQLLWSGGFPMTSDLLLSPLSEKVMVGIYESAVYELLSPFRYRTSGFQGLGFGHINHELTLIIFVERDQTSAILRNVNYRGVNLKVSYQVTRGIKPLAIYKDQGSNIVMGGTVADSNQNNDDQYGTRSVVIKQMTGNERFMLTCYHVACSHLLARNVAVAPPGNKITIPAKVSKSLIPSQSFFIGNARLDASADYALIQLPSDYNVVNTVPAGIGAISSYYTINELNVENLRDLEITKFGATTGKTEGKVVSYSQQALEIDYSIFGYKKVAINGLITATNICKAGDSGAPVVDEKNKFLGYVIAADSAPNGLCYIMPVAYFFFTHDYLIA